MKILFSSYAYAPSLGGIETVSALLAREFITAGHEVMLITETPAANAAKGPFPIIRNPTVRQLRQQLGWCDVMLYNNISLRHLVPALLSRKPMLVVHQTWIRKTTGGLGWNDRFKRALLPRAKNVAISRAIADDIATPAEIIGNPYDDQVFKLLPGIARDGDIIFVGRLVSDKGADLLLHAVAELNEPKPSLTIVGVGPEETNLRQLARELKLEVTFAGAESGGGLAEMLNRYRIIAIPSRWPEPFGVVALEGIACGCVPIGSEQGGLREAIGPCGLTFANGDIAQLSRRLRELLLDSSRRERLHEAAPAHLQQFRASVVAGRYLEILRELAA